MPPRTVPPMGAPGCAASPTGLGVTLPRCCPPPIPQLRPAARSTGVYWGFFPPKNCSVIPRWGTWPCSIPQNRGNPRGCPCFWYFPRVMPGCGWGAHSTHPPTSDGPGLTRFPTCRGCRHPRFLHPPPGALAPSRAAVLQRWHWLGTQDQLGTEYQLGGLGTGWRASVPAGGL